MTTTLDFAPTALNALNAPSIEIEESVLGSILLDPDILAEVETLPLTAFSISSHRLIYKEILTIRNAGRKPDLLTVTHSLSISGKLTEVGGKSKLVQLMDRTVHSGYTKQHVELLKENHDRQYLASSLRKIAELPETETNLDEAVRQATEHLARVKQSRKQGSSHAAPGTLIFDQMLERVREMQEMEDPGRREWELQGLAKQAGRSMSQMMKAYELALANQPPFELTDALELLEKAPDKFDWLVAGLLPMATTALLYAEGGTGKTLFTNSIIKAVACGQKWNGFPTKQGKVLLMETDEPAVVTAQNLKMAGFESSLPPGHLLINSKWQFAQMQHLRDAIATHKPVLVVIDSLTSSNRTSASEEKDVEYGRCLYELRDIAMEFGCAILILHHENKGGSIRGSTAIKANVSEVWHLKRHTQLSQTQRLLEIEKSRCGCAGVRQLQLDTDDYSWQDQGDFDPSQAGNPATLPLKARLLNFLEEHPGIPFEPEELAPDFGGNKDAIRKTLERLWRSGLIQFEQRVKSAGKGSIKYKVYLVREVVQSLESAPSEGLGSGQPNCEALDNINLSRAKSEVVQSLESAPNQGLEALDKTTPVTPPPDSEALDSTEIHQSANTVINVTEQSSPTVETTVVHSIPLTEGDRVIWEDAPAHAASWNPFTIVAILGDTAMLDVFESPVPLDELRRCE